MSTTPDEPQRPGEPGSTFPTVRRGYHRPSVDAYAADAGKRLTAAERRIATVVEENRRLRATVSELQATCAHLRTAGLDERARDIISAADQRAAALVADAERAAADIVRRARYEAEVVDERARQELAWGRRQLSRQRAELASQQSALRDQLDSVRELTTSMAPGLAEPPELTFADVVGSRTTDAVAQHG